MLGSRVPRFKRVAMAVVMEVEEETLPEAPHHPGQSVGLTMESPYNRKGGNCPPFFFAVVWTLVNRPDTSRDSIFERPAVFGHARPHKLELP